MSRNPQNETDLILIVQIEAMKEAGVDACVFSSAANCNEEGSPAYIKSKLLVEVQPLPKYHHIPDLKPFIKP